MALRASEVRNAYKSGGFPALTNEELVRLSAVEPTMFNEIVSEYVRRKAFRQPAVTFRTSRNIYEFIRPHFEGLNEERCLLIMVNQKNNPLGVRILSIGGLAVTVVDPKKIFRELLLTERCTQFAIAHNHPSENSSPSQLDNILTSNLYKASKIMMFNMLDHLIVCSNEYYSFADEGKLI